MFENKKLSCFCLISKIITARNQTETLRSKGKQYGVNNLPRKANVCLHCHISSHLSQAAVQQSNCVLSFWKVGNSINIKQTTRLLILKHVSKQFLDWAPRKTLMTIFYQIYLGLDLLHTLFGCGQFSFHGLCIVAAPISLVHASCVLQLELSQERTTTLSLARFILRVWKVVKIVYEQIQVKRWGLSGIREQPKSLVLYFRIFSLKSFLNP